MESQVPDGLLPKKYPPHPLHGRLGGGLLLWTKEVLWRTGGSFRVLKIPSILPFSGSIKHFTRGIIFKAAPGSLGDLYDKLQHAC